MGILQLIIAIPTITIALLLNIPEQKNNAPEVTTKTNTLTEPDTDPLIRTDDEKKDELLGVKSVKPAKIARRKEFTSETIDELLDKHFGKYAPQARKIMLCESGGNPKAINNNPRTRDYSIGLFQINLYGNLKYSRPSRKWLLNAENNIKYASEMFKAQGWTPWSCKKVLDNMR